ncbi:MAG: nitroreductase/quinone reductase family protein [Myxococcota bacterium]
MTDRNQKSDPFDTPDRAVIPDITRGHVAAMEASEDGEPEPVWVMYNMSHLLLRTVGRRSGRIHKVALPYWLDDRDTPIVVGSYAGAKKHPAWYLNLTDREVNAELYVRTRFDQYWTEAEILTGDERQRIWDAMTEDRSYYRDYQLLTERELPLIRLAKKRPAEGMPPG